MRNTQTYVRMVKETHDEQGYFLGPNPICIDVPIQEALESIANSGYIPLDAYMRLLKNGENESGVLEHIHILTKLAQLYVGDSAARNVKKIRKFCTGVLDDLEEKCQTRKIQRE